MATDSNILAWRMPWREEPARPQTWGRKRVRHDWATNTIRFLLSGKLQWCNWNNSFLLVCFGLRSLQSRVRTTNGMSLLSHYIFNKTRSGCQRHCRHPHPFLLFWTQIKRTADGAKLCEISLPQLQSHPSFILVFFGSRFQQLCWQWWQSLSNTANWWAFRTSLLGYLTWALYSPTCLWSVWMNLLPSLNKAPERVAVCKIFRVYHANWFTDLGAVSLLTGDRKQGLRQMLEDLR